MQISLSSGDYEIIASGQAFLFEKSGNLKINVSDNANINLSVVFEFLDDDSGKRTVKKEVINDTLFLECFNFTDNSAGLIEPAHIANVDGKQVFLMFWAYLEGGSEHRIRSVKYTFFYK